MFLSLVNAYSGHGFCINDPRGYNLSQIVKQTWPDTNFVNWQINVPGERILADTLLKMHTYCCRDMAICADPRIHCVPNPFGRLNDVACVECPQGIEWKRCPLSSGSYECRKLGTLSDVRDYSIQANARKCSDCGSKCAGGCSLLPPLATRSWFTPNWTPTYTCLTPTTAMPTTLIMQSATLSIPSSSSGVHPSVQATTPTTSTSSSGHMSSTTDALPTILSETSEVSDPPEVPEQSTTQPSTDVAAETGVGSTTASTTAEPQSATSPAEPINTTIRGIQYEPPLVIDLASSATNFTLGFMAVLAIIF